MKRWQKFIQVLVAGIMLVALCGASAAAAPAVAAARAQPQLLQMAAAQPGARLSVIVQKADPSDQAEKLVAGLGGVVTKDLHIINAFAAELPAQAVAKVAQAPGVRWVSLDAPTHSAVSSNVVYMTWATMAGAQESMTYSNAAAIYDSALGPNGTFGYGYAAKGSFAGFDAQITPGMAISKVEFVVKAYVAKAMSHQIEFKVYVGGSQVVSVFQKTSIFDGVVGTAANAGLVAVDITGQRSWQWADFNNDMQVAIDQEDFGFGSSENIYFDAVGLRVTSASGNSQASDTGGDPSSLAAIGAPAQVNVYNQVIRASNLWDTAAKLQGKGVTVAVVDSGVYKTKDIQKRLRASVNFNPAYHDAADRYGHGTFVAGIIAGNGSQSDKKYVGVAPRADIVNVRVSDDQGASTESDVINGLQWVVDNRSKYNIRVANLSLNSSVAQSYHTSPLDAAVEILWFNGIVVVVAAGNNGTATLYPPANDPFVITVGATDDKVTPGVTDDVIASFSAYGTAESGLAKPELVAPGKNIIGLLPENDKLNMSATRSANRIDPTYFKMSGTSIAAPIVSGAVALLLQDEPNLTPDQVKYRLKATANKSWPGYNAAKAGAGYLDVYAAVNSTTTQSANTGIAASNLLTTGSNPVNSSVNWNSVNWNSVNWNSVNWNSVNWNSVNWNSDYWGQ